MSIIFLVFVIISFSVIQYYLEESEIEPRKRDWLNVIEDD